MNAVKVPEGMARKIAAFLSRFTDSPISKGSLSRYCDAPDRVVRAAVTEAVLNGSPIVTDRSNGGYVYTTDTEKIGTEIARLRSHASAILDRARALEAWL